MVYQGWINPGRVSRVDRFRSQGQYTIQTMLDYWLKGSHFLRAAVCVANEGVRVNLLEVGVHSQAIAGFQVPLFWLFELSCKHVFTGIFVPKL